MTKQQVRGAVILLGLILLYTAYRFWQPPLIAVVGPTAAGKTRLGLDLARVPRRRDRVLRQPAGLSRPRHRQRQADARGAPGRAASPHRRGGAHRRLLGGAVRTPRRGWRSATSPARGRLPLVVGGTGLYLRALLQGLFEGPSRDPALRQRLERLAERHGDDRLHRLLRRVDPETAARVEPRDRVRVVRALEVYFLTGRPLSRHHEAPPEPLRGFRVRVLVLDPGPAGLRPAVVARTRRMFAEGLVEEVRRLLGRGPVRGPAAAPRHRLPPGAWRCSKGG